MATSPDLKLFQPICIGTTNLQHRVVLAPLTRCRADLQRVPGALMLEYYKQRTSVLGTLAITEATCIDARVGAYFHTPGIWNDEQIAGWKPVRPCPLPWNRLFFFLHSFFPLGCSSLFLLTELEALSPSKLTCFCPPFLLQVVDAVHENGSFIYLQLWALGRAALPDVLQKEGHPLVAPSPIPIPPKTKNDNSTSPPLLPRALTVEEIREYVRLYATAAENAVLRAGFDGVEIHAANGYLPDQFLQTNANDRTDAYGGSVQNRVRFVLEVTDAVVRAVGAHRVGIRFSPWSTVLGEFVCGAIRRSFFFLLCFLIC